MSLMCHNSEINNLIRPSVEALGYELVGCDVHHQKLRSLFRVYIDKSAGVNLDDCEKVSRQISTIPELETFFKGPYTLEVSSPGLERPLFCPEHFQRFLGHKVQIRLGSPLNQRRNFSGILISADAHGAVIDCEGKQVELQFNQIEKANISPKL